MKKYIIIPIFLPFLVLCLGGCVYITHYKELMLLKRIAANQREIQEYMDAQEKKFYRLMDDVLNNRLIKGASMEMILAVYGEPVFCKTSQGGDKGKEICLYRHPAHYFFSDNIYLNFDMNERLDSWELIRADNRGN